MAKLLEERKVENLDLSTLLAKARVVSESKVEHAVLAQYAGYSCVISCQNCNTFRAPQTKKYE